MQHSYIMAVLFYLYKTSSIRNNFSTKPMLEDSCLVINEVTIFCNLVNFQIIAYKYAILMIIIIN